MAQDPRDIVLEHLRYIRGRVDSLSDDISSLSLRMTALDRHMSGMYSAEVDQTSEMDRLKQRVDRIERRLELNEG